jgi:hypothetical protein
MQFVGGIIGNAMMVGTWEWLKLRGQRLNRSQSLPATSVEDHLRPQSSAAPVGSIISTAESVGGLTLHDSSLKCPMGVGKVCKADGELDARGDASKSFLFGYTNRAFYWTA